MNLQTIAPKTRVVRENDDGSQEEIYFRTDLELNELNYLARKAARNKSRKAKDGPVHITVLEIKRIA